MSRSSPAGEVHAILLAAGLSRRMGERNKLLIDLGGEIMVRRVARALADAHPASIIAVTGHEHEKVGQSLEGLPVILVHNPDFAGGMSTSLRAGLHALPPTAKGALVALGDMPALTARDYGLLLEAFRREGADAIVRAAYDGHPGNPVILPRNLFETAAKIRGDAGARALLGSSGVRIVDVEIGVAARLDIDAYEDLQEFSRGG